MKRIIIFVVSAMCCSNIVSAQRPGYIALSGSSSPHRSCEFSDRGGLIAVYVFHYFTEGSTSSKWKLDIGETGWTHLGEHASFADVEGTALSGISISYGACLEGTFQIMLINFWGANADPCTRIRTMPSPTAVSGYIETTDCDGVTRYPGGGISMVNENAMCGGIPCFDYNAPARSYTWGRVKALYR